VRASDIEGDVTEVSVSFETEAPPPVVVTPILSFAGQNAGDQLGLSLAPAGDVNQDGFRDLVAGARGSDQGASEAGAALVYSGADGALLLTLLGEAAGDSFGKDVDLIGDLDLDGHTDLLVVAPLDATLLDEGGSARVVSGLDGSELYTVYGANEGARFGSSVTATGDVNGDGVLDFAVGAHQDSSAITLAGRLDVFSGLDGSLLWRVDGEADGIQLGISVAGPGDVNLDGKADVLVGAWGDDTNGLSAGGARVYSGEDGSLLYSFLGDSADDHMGNAVGRVGDVDGDGASDLLVAAWVADQPEPNAGLARVFSGADGSLIHEIQGPSAQAQFGAGLEGVGDIDADGHADFIVGAPYETGPQGERGSTRLYSGKDMTELAIFRGPDEQSLWGFDVAGVGDMDGDGLLDLAIGEPWNPSAGALTGAAHVFSGAALSTQSLDVGEGGAARIEFALGAQHAGRSYHVVGSVDGLPGLDPWSLHSLAVQGSSELEGGLGIVDPSGRATALLLLAPGRAAGLQGNALVHELWLEGERAPSARSEPLLLID